MLDTIRTENKDTAKLLAVIFANRNHFPYIVVTRNERGFFYVIPYTQWSDEDKIIYLTKEAVGKFPAKAVKGARVQA